MNFSCDWNRITEEKCLEVVEEEYTLCSTHKLSYYKTKPSFEIALEKLKSMGTTQTSITPLQTSLFQTNPYSHLTFETLKATEQKASSWLITHKTHPSFPKMKLKYNYLVKMLNLRTPT